MTLAPNSRVRLAREVDNYPTGVFPAGETGTVTRVDDDCTWVRLDRAFPELVEWGNELQVMEHDADSLTDISTPDGASSKAARDLVDWLAGRHGVPSALARTHRMVHEHPRYKPLPLWLVHAITLLEEKSRGQ
jgi:hypothetical protein